MKEAWQVHCPFAAKFVLLALADHANTEREAWPSIGSISKKCSMSRRTVVTHLGKLLEAGHITIKQKGGGKLATRYVVKPAVQGLHRCAVCTTPVRVLHGGLCEICTAPVRDLHPNPNGTPIEPKENLPVSLSLSAGAKPRKQNNSKPSGIGRSNSSALTPLERKIRRMLDIVNPTPEQFAEFKRLQAELEERNS
jgi:DNA-binding MarR family transcriptional regulator